jgi:hypothetical protein
MKDKRPAKRFCFCLVASCLNELLKVGVSDGVWVDPKGVDGYFANRAFAIGGK